jgi:hypothetical protein
MTVALTTAALTSSRSERIALEGRRARPDADVGRLRQLRLHPDQALDHLRLRKPRSPQQELTREHALMADFVLLVSLLLGATIVTSVGGFALTVALSGALVVAFAGQLCPGAADKE